MSPQVLEYLIGPAGAVVVMAMMLYGVYKIVVERLLPLTERLAQRHLDQFDRLIDAHDKDRAVWAAGLAKLEADFDDLRGDVHEARVLLAQLVVHGDRDDSPGDRSAS